MREPTRSGGGTEPGRSALLALCVALLLSVAGALIAVNIASPLAQKAVVEQFTATADSTGKITISFVTVKDNAQVNGIEVLSRGRTSIGSGNSWVDPPQRVAK